MKMKIINDLVQWEKAWLEARAWKISWTKLWIVMAWPKAQDSLIYELIAETISPLEETYQTPAMERGNYLEQFWVEEYEKQTWDKVSFAGLVVKNEYHICSPDWLVYNKDNLITKALEVKCLSAKKMLKYMTCDSFLDVYKIDKLYFWQVINYFLVIDTLESLTFYLYNPDIYDKNMQTYSIPITRAELQTDIDKAEEKLKGFKENWDNLKLKLLKW